MSKKNRSRWTPHKQPNPAHEQGEVFAPASESSLSPAQLAANRANSLLSTGPVTDAGKEIVSVNATRHGLTGNKFRVLAGESQAEFDQLLAGFLRSEDPVGDDEIAMVHQMAECVWLSRRSVRMENDCFAVFESGSDEERRAAHKSIALYLRYQTVHDRAFTRYATEMRKRRNERRKADRGFVSKMHKEAAEKRRDANEIRRQELHELRQQTMILRQQRMQINNRLAEAKLDRPKTLAAAA